MYTWWRWRWRLPLASAWQPNVDRRRGPTKLFNRLRVYMLVRARSAGPACAHCAAGGGSCRPYAHQSGRTGLMGSSHRSRHPSPPSQQPHAHYHRHHHRRHLARRPSSATASRRRPPARRTRPASHACVWVCSCVCVCLCACCVPMVRTCKRAVRHGIEPREGEGIDCTRCSPD